MELIFFNKEKMKIRWHKIFGGVLGALIGMSSFLLIGISLPYLYTKYLDNTEYYYIKPNPLIVTETNLKPCDDVKYFGSRYSDIDFNGDVSVDLMRVGPTGENKIQVLDGIVSIVSVSKGVADMELNYTLPCNLVDGTYYLHGVVFYEVNGVDKTYHWESQQFIVTNELEEN